MNLLEAKYIINEIDNVIESTLTDQQTDTIDWLRELQKDIKNSVGGKI